MANPNSTLVDADNPFLTRAYALSNATEARDLYDEWAKQYDRDLEAEDYAFPTLAAQALVDQVGGRIEDRSILDAGCGTGLVGAQLGKLGARNIVGLDISPGMLEVARKTGSYGLLEEADLSKPIDKPDGTFDAVICVGTLTRGHVGPRPVLEEFARIVKAGGAIVATVLEEVWESGGFRAEVERLGNEGKVQVVHSKEVGVRSSANMGGRLLVLQKLQHSK